MSLFLFELCLLCVMVEVKCFDCVVDIVIVVVMLSVERVFLG